MRGIEADQSGQKLEDKSRRGLTWAQIPHHTWLEMLSIF